MSAVGQFSSDVVCSKILDSIIDNHNDTTVVRTMQNKMVQALMYEREKLFQDIFNVANKPKDNRDITIVMKMKKEMVKLIKENHEIVIKYKSLKDKALRLINLVKEQNEELEKLREPDNTVLEQSERYHNDSVDEHRRDDYERHTEHDNQDDRHAYDRDRLSYERPRPQTPKSNIARNYDNIMEKKDTVRDTEDRTLTIPPEKKYPYTRVPRTHRTFQPEPPISNVMRFASEPTPMVTMDPGTTFGGNAADDNPSITKPTQDELETGPLTITSSSSSSAVEPRDSIAPASNDFFSVDIN
jgi:hypothetical protein